MPAERDPLSVAYDPVVRPVLIQAIRHLRNHQRGPLVWIASTRAELRALDKGGRTRQERAFTRSAYYHVFKVPRNSGAPVDYSLTLDWGDRLEPSSRGRWARSCRVTLHRFGRGSSRRRSPSWVPGTGSGFQSIPGNRIDS